MSAVGDIYEVKTFCTQQQQTAVNVCHFRVTGVSGLSAADTIIAAHMSSTIGPKLKELLNNTASYYGCTIQRIYPNPKGNAFISLLSAGAGTAGANPLPKQVAGIFTKLTAFAGRKFRGRYYVPFPSQVDNQAVVDQPTAGYMVRLGQLAAVICGTQTVFNDGDDSSLTPIVYQRDDPAASAYIVGATARQKWATQRRRGDYGRPNTPPT